MPGIEGYAHDGGVQPNEHRPTDKSRGKVVGLRCAGYTYEEIAEYFDISRPTLEKYYKEELREGKLNKIEGVSNKAYELAMAGDTKMIEMILKMQAKWAAAKPPEDDEKDKMQMTLMEKLMDKL
jgi:predicted transcriptional regulator